MPNKRLPNSLHKLRGTYRPGRHGPQQGVIEIAGGVPLPPDWMPESGRSEWQRLLGLMEHTGVLAQTDRGTMAQYCLLYSRLEASVRSPQEAMFSAADHTQMRLLAVELGLTPSARSKIESTHTEGLDPKDPWAEL